VADFFDNWTTQLRKGLLELAILNALGTNELYGYDLVRRLSDLDSIAISEGTVYPILSRLRNDGFVETYLEESPDGPARKYYRLTSQGREELRRMYQHWHRLLTAVEQIRKERR
jgi:PadR family transcriptional regulator PadR